jgi:hypothetical protein
MLKTGQPDVAQDAPSHVDGIQQGNALGAYESMAGHLPDGRSQAERSTGINAGFEQPIDSRMPNLSPA